MLSLYAVCVAESFLFVSLRFHIHLNGNVADENSPSDKVWSLKGKVSSSEYNGMETAICTYFHWRSEYILSSVFDIYIEKIDNSNNCGWGRNGKTTTKNRTNQTMNFRKKIFFCRISSFMANSQNFDSSSLRVLCHFPKSQSLVSNSFQSIR